VDPAQNDLGGHAANHMRFLDDVRYAKVTGPAVCLDGAANGDASPVEGSPPRSRRGGDRRQADTARPGAQKFCLAAASAAAGRTVVFGPTSNLHLVRLDQVAQRIGTNNCPAIRRGAE
jgi:hypothetical protein